MTWFETLTGFPEGSGDAVRSQLRLEGGKLTSLKNDWTCDAGLFSTPTLGDLRQSVSVPQTSVRKIQVSELVSDVQSLHQDPANEHAVFQVASQFNCLEMAGPLLTPEDGVGIYQNDPTQGPACCICAGGGTIVRNYFVQLDGRLGQSKDHQINCLALIGSHFGNDANQYWKMQNGYCFPSKTGLANIEKQLADYSETQLDDLRAKLMFGLQANTEVTLGDSGHRVTQVFCSALPVAYSSISPRLWNHFPRLILDATYEATFLVALQNFATTGCPKLYLTLVGGGVFGNKRDWILSSISRSLKLFADTELDVKIVSYGSSQPQVADFVSRQNS